MNEIPNCVLKNTNHKTKILFEEILLNKNQPKLKKFEVIKFSKTVSKKFSKKKKIKMLSGASLRSAKQKLFTVVNFY